ncbi:hypothetical protein [Arthrobacter sp. Y81]|uniref:hypothetical protein n=1 Tax=Arthrobacter sp. Y81 TaxID=2058897 RepID=UPI000CE4722D|nr:hypothetical protein [Arthrobacter sp. Y81]
MFWGLNGDQWLQLWSGTVGAFVAAVIGGVVALVVVNLANRHQSRISAHQLRQQAADVSRSRENQVIADLVVACHDMRAAVLVSDAELEAVRRRMHACLVTGKLESSDPTPFKVIMGWPHWIMNAGNNARQSPKSEQRVKWHSDFLERVGKFARAVEAWPNATPDERTAIVEELRLSPGGIVMIPADPIPPGQRAQDDRGPFSNSPAGPDTDRA